MNSRFAIALMPATAMPNQRARLFPLSTANDAQTSAIPTMRTIQPQVRRSLKTYVEFGAYTLLLDTARMPSMMFQAPARPSMMAANATQPEPLGASSTG